MTVPDPKDRVTTATTILAEYNAAMTEFEKAVRRLDFATEPLWKMGMHQVAIEALHQWLANGVVAPETWDLLSVWPYEDLMPAADSLGLSEDVVSALIEKMDQ